MWDMIYASGNGNGGSQFEEVALFVEVGFDLLALLDEIGCDYAHILHLLCLGHLL